MLASNVSLRYSQIISGRPSSCKGNAVSLNRNLPCSNHRILHRHKHSHRRHVVLASGDGGTGSGSGGGKGGDGGKGDGDENEEEDENELIHLQQADQMAAARGVKLPGDFVEAALQGGLRKAALARYLALQGTFGGWLASRIPGVRDRLLADPKFIFKCIVEVLIDSGCATVAEVRKRGDDFWKEFEFYMSDMAVGLVLDVALVTLLTPCAVIGAKPKNTELTGFRRYLSRLPAACLEGSIPGVREYSVADRAAGFVVKGLEYSLAGMAAGFVGQGIANSVMVMRRNMHGAKEDDVKVPDLMKTTLVWGMFMGLSSNTRYQIVFGLERLVDTMVGKRLPFLSYYTTVGIRFVNNVIGGEQFIDMARWAGVQ